LNSFAHQASSKRWEAITRSRIQLWTEFFQIPVTIRHYAEQGTWSIDFFLSDKVGNFVSMGKGALIAPGFPTAVQVLDANPESL